MNNSDEAVGRSDPAQAAAAQLRAALPLGTGRCQLRGVRIGDVEDVHAYRGLAQVTRFLGHPPLDLEQARALVTEWVGECTAVTVVAEHEGRVVGDVRLRFRPSAAMAPASTDAVEAALGYAFHPAVHGRGLATECVGTVLEAVLAPGGVRRVTARVFAPAAASARLLVRLGFTRDGIDREAVLGPDGSWWDDELWSLLATDRGIPRLTARGPLT